MSQKRTARKGAPQSENSFTSRAQAMVERKRRERLPVLPPLQPKVAPATASTRPPAILLIPPLETIRKVDEIVDTLLKLYDPRVLSAEELAEARRIAETKGTSEANLYLKRLTARENPISGRRQPTRQSVAMYLLQIGIDRFLESANTVPLAPPAIKWNKK